VEWEHLRSFSQALSSYELSRDYAVKVVENSSASHEGAGASVSESAMYQNATKSIMDIQAKVIQREGDRSRKQQKKEQIDTMRFYKDK
jgi:hypothetical protein